MNDHYPLDLIPFGFHLWGYMKDLVYRTTLHGWYCSHAEQLWCADMNWLETEWYTSAAGLCR